MGSLRKAIGMQKQAASQMQKRAYAQELYKKAYAREMQKRIYMQELQKQAGWRESAVKMLTKAKPQQIQKLMNPSKSKKLLKLLAALGVGGGLAGGGFALGENEALQGSVANLPGNIAEEIEKAIALAQGDSMFFGKNSSLRKEAKSTAITKLLGKGSKKSNVIKAILAALGLGGAAAIGREFPSTAGAERALLEGWNPQQSLMYHLTSLTDQV